jgi:cell division septation protein DedD
MALNLRTPPSERYLIEDDDGRVRGPRLGAAQPEWDREDASRNPAGMASEYGPPSDGWRRWFRSSFALLALAGFVGVLWYAYEWGLGGDEAVELPTVTAETGPEKEKPSDPGGLQVPYQDQLVLNEDDADDSPPRIERLLPPPEAPMTPALTAIAPSYDELPPALPEEGESQSDNAAASGQAGTLQPAGEPAAEGSAQTATAASAPEAPPVPEAQAPKTQVETTQAAKPIAPEPKSTASQATETQSAAVPPAASVAADPNGQFAVQLVSLKDSGAAEREWRRLQGVFPTLLGDKSLLLQKANVAGVGTVYRLRAGPFATRDTAASLCAQLKSKQQDCLVVNR